MPSFFGINDGLLFLDLQVFEKHILIYLPFVFFLMDVIMSTTKKVFTLTNIAGSSLGLTGLSVLLATKAAALLPLLFAPLVCGTFGLLLFLSKPSMEQKNLIAQAAPTSAQK